MKSVCSSIPRIIIAGTHSGCGKTTAASGIMAALTARGLKVQPFKVGPDFIDPSHHSAICARTSRNLDPYMMGEEGVKRCFVSACQGADIAVIEGVMGLYDGVDASDVSSTAHVARILNAPVILVVDVKGMSRSAAALVEGYQRFDARLCFAGVIMTKGGSEKHKTMASSELTLPLLGWIPRSEELAVESRHLGLKMGFEDERMKNTAALMEETCRLDDIISAASGAGRVSAMDEEGETAEKARIGVAMDAAFCFYYADNFAYLRRAGAELVFFSPMEDSLPQADAYYFGGGYPELHAVQLSKSRCKDELRLAAEKNIPVFGECGGLMWLSRSIELADGSAYKMAGLMDGECQMQKRFAALNYCRGTTTDVCIFGGGINISGHEFHYSTFKADRDARFAFRLTRGKGIENGNDSMVCGSAQAGYTHLYFGKEVAESFVGMIQK